MIKITSVKPLENFVLFITFDNGVSVHYDMKDDLDLPGYDDLRLIPGLFQNVNIDSSKTCIYWSDTIDLPSDTLFEYGERV